MDMMPVTGAQAEVFSGEKSRLKALDKYAVLDTPAEEEFDALTRLAAYIARTPIALISLIDGQRQWFKSKVGLSVEQTPRSQAFCHYTIQGEEPLEVNDARLDERFLKNPLVTGDPHIRYYCGVPLSTPEGEMLGSLCVIDKTPKQLDAYQLQALQTLAGEVMARLELRRQKQELEEQKRQLEYSEAQYRALFEESQGYLFTHSMEGTILSANGAAVEALGYRKEELVGKNMSCLLVLGQSSLLKDYFKGIRAGRAVSGVSRIVTATGEERYWQYRNFPSLSAGGTPYVICSAQDVTDKEIAARLLREAKEELEEQVQLRTQELLASNTALQETQAELDVFLYRASHDLKGPLCSMEGLLSLAQMEEAPGQQRQYFTLMQQTVHKLNRVLQSLLSYTKNSHYRVMRERVHFESLLEQTLTGLREVKGFERVKVETYLDILTPFYSDAERVFTVLRNVISNSINFQNYSLEEPAVNICISCSAQGATIVVRDNGVGIDEKEQADIFRMFTRSSSQSTGSGLGLFVTGEIVKKLGGQISLQSQPGKGTQVSIRIPSQADQP
jgi:PAS domain S-box-containing protein